METAFRAVSALLMPTGPIPETLIELSKPPTKPKCMSRVLQNTLSLRFNGSGAQRRP